MAPTADLPGLLGSDVLLQFLQDGLQQIEADQGHTDDEARHLLKQLQQQTAIMQALAEGQEEQHSFTDIQLAEQIDSLDAQLAQLEATLSSADNETKQLLGQSAAKWLGPTSCNHDNQHPASISDAKTSTVSSSSVPAAGVDSSNQDTDGARHKNGVPSERQQMGSDSSEPVNQKE